MRVEYRYAKFNSSKLYYAQLGNGKNTTVFVLGWLSNVDTFPIKELTSKYKDKLKENKLIFVHLSNHYKSDYSNKTYDVDLYTEELKDFCKALKFKKINLVAHSAGGRYAINFASKYGYLVNKLVLVSPAGLSSKKANLNQLNKVRGYFHKFNNLSVRQEQILKETFLNVYGINLTNKLSSIQCPTLVIWGTNDNTTPFKRSAILTKSIKNCLFYPIKNKDHMVIRDKTAFSYILNFIDESPRVINSLVKLSKEKELSKELKRYQYNYLRISPTYQARKLFVLFINKNKLKHVEAEYLQIESALNKLCGYMLKSNNQEYKDTLNLQGINFNKLDSRCNSPLYNYSRVDSIFDGSTSKIVEFNARRPQMFEDVDWFNEYFQSFTFLNKPKHNLTDKIIESIKIQSKDKNISPKNIILISDFDKKSSFSFYSRLKQAFKTSSVQKLTTKSSAKKISESLLINNSLVIDQKKIDLIIVQSLGFLKNSFFYSNGKIVNTNVRKAYYKNNLQISSPLTSSVFGRKQSLKLLENKETQQTLNLNKNEITAINRLPKTKEFKDVKVLSKKYVVKIQGLGGGTGVYFYKDIGASEKKLFIRLAKKKKNNILLQEKIDLVPIKIYSLKTLKPFFAAISLEPFIVNTNGKPEIVDYTARAVPQKWIKDNTKFNPVFNEPNIWFGGVMQY